MKNSIVKEKSYAFALNVLDLSRALRKRQEYEIAAGQILRAGTSIGANVEEALAGISGRDFVAKMGIASKEARETHYWLRLVRDSKIVPSDQLSPALAESLELLRMLTAIVKTCQNGKASIIKHLKLKIENCEDRYA